MLVDQTRLLRATGRSPWVVLVIALIGGITWLACLSPAVSAALDVTPHDMGIVVITVVLAHALMSVLYFRVSERSVLYGVSALLDQCVKLGGTVWLIYRGGHADSFFWLLYVIIGVINAAAPEYRRILGTIFVAFPLLLVLAFALSGNWAQAGVAFMATILASFAFVISSLVAVRYAEVMVERERLARELADLRVRDDRLRIARDLHDGIGADLAALAWRARRIQAELGESALSDQLNGMTERATHSIDDLRSIVWALREKAQTWEELVAYLRQRCHELTGDRAQLEVIDRSEGTSATVSGDLCLHLVRSGQEAVRNALRHGQARKIVVTMEWGQVVTLTVEDDGIGIPAERVNRGVGGLANLRARAASMGGELRVERLPQGTRLSVHLPQQALTRTA